MSSLPSVRDSQHADCVLERLPPEAQAGLVQRLVDLVMLLALETDLDDAEEDALPVGQLRAERDGFVRVWRRPRPASPEQGA